MFVKFWASQRELFVRSIWSVFDPDPLTGHEYVPPVLKLQWKPLPSVPHTDVGFSDSVPFPFPGIA